MKLVILIIIDIENRSQNGTTIFNILDNTTELYKTKYIIGEIFSSDRETLYKNPSDQTVFSSWWCEVIVSLNMFFLEKTLENLYELSLPA